MKALAQIAAVLLMGMVAAQIGRSAEPLVERRSGQWRYLDLPAAHPEAMQSGQWAAVTFDDSRWPEGQAILGYGDADVATELSYGDQVQEKQSAACTNSLRRGDSTQHLTTMSSPCRPS